MCTSCWPGSPRGQKPPDRDRPQAGQNGQIAEAGDRLHPGMSRLPQGEPHPLQEKQAHPAQRQEEGDGACVLRERREQIDQQDIQGHPYPPGERQYPHGGAQRPGADQIPVPEQHRAGDPPQRRRAGRA